MKEKKMPYIGKDANGFPILYVKEEPFLMISGELHNSAANNLEHMEKEVWPYLRQIKMNTVILPIAWEDVEPEEGKFDFSLLQGLIDQHRREGMKMVLLWFGLWKNGESTYVPSWVKEDYERFFRARYKNGQPSDTISPMCEEAIEADKKAFSQVMKFLSEYDHEEQTVIMVQIENEVGSLKSERDYSEKATGLYHQQIPEQMYQFVKAGDKKEVDWEMAFGTDAPEMFMAYHYARALEIIASAGKKVYPLPMYTNAWLKQHPDRPGIYPSGGPVYSMLPVWKEMAPSLDLLAPDIYLPDLKAVCEAYSIYENPIFIPEARRDPVTASNVFYAFAGAMALGFAPFAIEDFMRTDLEAPDVHLLELLNIESSGFNGVGTGPYLQNSYEILTEMYPLMLKYRGTDKMMAFIRSNPYERGAMLHFDEFDLQLDYLSGKSGSAGIIIKDENGFFITGSNVEFTPMSKVGDERYVTIVRMEEGAFQNGEWKMERILNGDELSENKLGDMAESKYMRICLYK